MALYQIKKIIDILISDKDILDYMVIHRFGKLYPSENIILILVAVSTEKRFYEKLIKCLNLKLHLEKGILS